MDYQKEVILKVRKYIELEIIIEDKAKRKLAANYLEKARHNFLLAKFVNKGTASPKVLELVGFDPEFTADDWVINAAYYAMYMAAQAVLAALGIKCENHNATPFALEYYFVFRNKLEQEFVDLLKKHQDIIKNEDIELLRAGKESRLAAQYDVTVAMEKERADIVLADAGTFLDRMERLLAAISK